LMESDGWIRYSFVPIYDAKVDIGFVSAGVSYTF